jgi:hypothetical protein
MKTGIQISTGDINEELIKRTVLVYMGVLFLVLIAVGFVMPWFGEVTKIKTEFVKTEARTKEMSQGLELLDSISGTITNTDQELLGKIMPLVFDPGRILGSLRSLSQSAGVNIVDYSLAGGSLEEGDAKKSTTLNSTRLKVKVAGTTASVMSFMKMVEESAPLASVAEVSVGEVAKLIGGNGGMTNLSLTVDYYSLPIGTTDKLAMNKFIINEKDLATLTILKSYQQIPISNAVSVPGGNQNLFGD